MSKMHKNDVRNVDLNRLSILVKLNKTNNDFNVKNALRPLSGKLLTLDYQRHLGLTEKHKIQYINWYSFLKNQMKIATL